MADRSSNARVSDSWESKPSGPETKLLNYFQAMPATSFNSTDRALYNMLLSKQSDGTLDVIPPMRTDSARVADSWNPQTQTYQQAENLSEIKSKYDKTKTAIVPISPGSNVYRVIDTTGYQSPTQRIPGYETQAPTLAYYVVEPKQGEAKIDTKKSKVAPVMPSIEAGKGTTTKSNATTTSVKTTPKPELFYSNDFKQLQPLTLDKLLINVVQNARDLLTSYNYSSADEEDAELGQASADNNSETVSRKIPLSLQNDILDLALNNKISQYNDISLRIMNQIFNQIKNYKSLDSYNKYLSIFSGPFYDEQGEAYYKIVFNVDPLDGIIVDGSYVIQKEEIG